MIKTKKIDYNNCLLITVVGLLLLVGIIILTSVSTVYSQERFDTPYYYLFRQLIHIAIGLFCGYLLYKIRLDLIKKWSTVIVIGNIILLMAVFIPGLGLSAGGAFRWVDLGPFVIQPAEFLKLSFIVFLAAWLAETTNSIKLRKKNKIDLRAFYPIFLCLILFLISALILIYQPNISALVILFSTALIIYFLSGTPLWHTIGVFLIGITGIALIIKVAPHAMNRVLVLFDPSYDPMGIGFQIKQISIAIGSGGLFGSGFGLGQQRMGYLPETISDTIFAVFAEETGFLGGLFLIILFILFLWAGFKISRNSIDKFSSLTAAGIASWIIIQTFVNIGAMLGIFPLTGVALPFISYGGSHLITELAAVGLLLNISRNKTKKI